ncbi:PREDICTED: protein hunchback-like [Trachymyrmex cornetzi]|uniref:protein hunchback-like n=1 Tax=Trachymyrmex cornetzi TaxID=471704 RepID=UPI00084EDDB8|nr:PREDICTED: protein hunchback-like [Trachymyrmex cornetzi]
MKRCEKNVESLRQTPEQQQEQKQEQQQKQQQHQQQTIAEEQQCPFLQSTTPVWGDRMVSNRGEQSAEETNNNFNFSFPYSIPSTSDMRTCNLSSSRNNSLSSISSLTESTMNSNQSFSDAQLPRRCRLCSYVANSRAQYIEHVITHSTFTKSSYVDNDNLNGYVDDEEFEDSGNELVKGKKKNKISKPKPCSKCDFMAKTKLALWLHLRQHFIQQECSGFICNSCPFATTLKHHMTFHWFSAHDDFKAYMCSECSYACVSKSMLTSHMKTHSEIYQYNCGSCSYKTKFCNAIKKHLKDSKHQPGLVLNPDGTPNPFATIDVYGNKRGPRRRALIEGKKELTETIEDISTNLRMTPPISSISTPSASVLSIPISSPTILDFPDSNTDQPLDLSMSTMTKRQNQSQLANFSKRKRKAVKLEYPTITISEKKFHIDDNATQIQNTDQTCTESSLSALLTASQSNLQEKNMTPDINIYKTSFICYHCCIIFASEIMYAVHMSFHKVKSPFTCAVCDRKCTDQITFFLHLIQTKHE